MAPPQIPDQPAQVSAPQFGRLTIIEENDALAPRPTDRWYTQGFELRYLSSPVGSGADFFGPAEHRFEFLVGQSIFTPANLHLSPPDPSDRPYAGWLYVGAALYRETGRDSLGHFELDLGVVGPASLAQNLQSSFHSLLGEHSPAGWAYQLKNEPGVVVTYDHRWRFGIPVGGIWSIDAVPEVGASVGNIRTHAEAGALLRFGHNLDVDYGPAHIRSGLFSGWFDPAHMQGAWGWYFFVGGQVRAIARDIFLDGNTFQSSASVRKEPIQEDLSAGASLFILDLAKLDFIVTRRSREFVGQSAPDWYSGVNISFRML